MYQQVDALMVWFNTIYSKDNLAHLIACKSSIRHLTSTTLPPNFSIYSMLRSVLYGLDRTGGTDNIPQRWKFGRGTFVFHLSCQVAIS